jgi:hypothetical protein
MTTVTSCTSHPDRNAVAYCRNCGRAMCADCRRESQGLVYCAECLASQGQAAAPAAAPAATPSYNWATQPGPNPGLALFLGLIPGVGAIYNGQYAKAFTHVVILGILMGLAEHVGGVGEPVFVLLTICFWAYMAGEAYHTARLRRAGQTVDEWSGLLSPGSRVQGTAGALILIVLGLVFLLDTLGLVRVNECLRYWPVILIVIGVLMLYQKLGAGPGQPQP